MKTLRRNLMEKSGFEDLVSNLVLKSESVQWFDAWCEIYFCSMIRCEHLWIRLDQPARCNSEQNLVSPAGAPPSFPGTVSEIQVREKHYTLRNTPKGDDEMRWNENSCFLMLGFWLCPVAILRLLQVHTVDQTVHPTPRHSFIALGLPRSAQCPCSLVY